MSIEKMKKRLYVGLVLVLGAMVFWLSSGGSLYQEKPQFAQKIEVAKADDLHNPYTANTSSVFMIYMLLVPLGVLGYTFHKRMKAAATQM